MLIHHTCFKCKRRFELDPIFIGFELSKLKKKDPNHYQAVCPGCRAVNKISVKEMQSDLDEVAEEIKKMVAEHEENKAKAKAEKQAKAKAEKTETNPKKGQKKTKPKKS